MGNICRKFRNIFFSDKERQIIRNNYCILNCKFGDKNNNFFFCSDCKEYFCQKCFEEYHKDHKKMTSIDKNKKCKNHNKDNKFYCFECQELFCDDDKQHNNHEKIAFINNEAIRKFNESLFNIMSYNKLISSTYKSYKENYFHMNSVINLGKFYKELDEMDLSELEWWSNKFRKARITDNNNLSEENKKLNLQLNDDSKLLLSKIMFNQLILIDLSKNEIKNIEFLDNMYLPFLEYLDMSDNKIEDIKPIAELNCKDLIEICLQKNNIQDINPFFDSKFAKLQILRLEENPFDKPKYIKVLKLYRKQVSYKFFGEKKNENEIKYFEKKYNCNIHDKKFINETDIHKIEYLNLSGLRGKDDIIRDLYYIIPKNNVLKRLKLDNNEIKDLSLLPRIPLHNLISLDLSMNRITNLKFLTRMETGKLKALYLNNNKINDITYLIRTIELGNIYGTNIFQNFKILSIHDNCFKELMNEDFFKNKIEIDK